MDINSVLHIPHILSMIINLQSSALHAIFGPNSIKNPALPRVMAMKQRERYGKKSATNVQNPLNFDSKTLRHIP